MPFLSKSTQTAALLVALATGAAAQDVIGEFPVVQVPAGNPMTAEKIRLGQALFYEEQLSSDDSMACGTCHQPDAGGGDPRAGARAPGLDKKLQTRDDEFGSPGMFLQDPKGNRLAHALFGLERQVTQRNPPTVLGAAFFNTQFWDSRALPTFKNLAGEVVLEEYASLESQAVGPMISSVEMGHDGRTWEELTAKLTAARPLVFASDVPKALSEFVGDESTYGPLFEKAFGSPDVTRERIAMAIASYERTLVPDQTPWDLGTMTPRQQHGFEVFMHDRKCDICHTSDNRMFTDGARRTVSLPFHGRPVKTPTLRNVGLRKRFMSGGQFDDLADVIAHYESVDFIHFDDDEQRVALIDFIANALTDPRAANREAPFDRPTLRSEREPVATPTTQPAVGAATDAPPAAASRQAGGSMRSADPK
jgi:cytochrome c peroxidase